MYRQSGALPHVMHTDWSTAVITSRSCQVDVRGRREGAATAPKAGVASTRLVPPTSGARPARLPRGDDGEHRSALRRHHATLLASNRRARFCEILARATLQQYSSTQNGRTAALERCDPSRVRTSTAAPSLLKAALRAAEAVGAP